MIFSRKYLTTADWQAAERLYKMFLVTLIKHDIIGS